jgi:zinc protease
MKLSPPLLLAGFVAACTPKTAGDPTTPPGDATPLATTNAVAAGDDSAPLKLDPKVRTGKLDNGMTYYIRQHPKPGKRALLWLAVDAGSVLEDDDQRGLAHFVEHMAFNGTARFEKNTLIDFMERSGMDFGADVNAYTSFDETVYQLQVPTDDGKMVSTGFDILEDWAGAITFAPEEVDKERGVVIEEWRLGRGAGQRIFDKQWPVFLAGSKYADRKPIGDKEILETAPVETLQRFYRDWYRPDLMAVIVVGDIDPDAIEKEVKARFAKIEGPAKPRERINVPVDLREDTRVDIETDPEASMTQVSVAIKGPLTGAETELDFRHDLVESVFHGMLRSRLDELRRKPDSPFVFAFSYTNRMGRSVDVFNLSAGTKPGQADAALRTLLLEVERVRRHGFLASELERERVNRLRGAERAVSEQDTVKGRVYARELVRHFLENQTMVSRPEALRLTSELLPTITLAEVNALAETWTARKDRVVTASGSARDTMPSKDDLLAITRAVAKRDDIAPYEDTATGGELIATAPTAGTITKKETIDELGLSVWTLSNGAKVIVKPTEFKNDEVLFEAFSPGGHSLAPDKTFVSAKYASSIVGEGGLAEYDPTALRKLLTGRVARVRAWIDEYEEGLTGSASPQDLETMLQLAHLSFVAPRKDPEAFSAWQQQMRTFVKNRDANPRQVFNEKMTQEMTADHPRRRPMTVEEVDEADLDAAYTFYQQRFADAGDFTFVFVGNVDVVALEELAATYLASLPSTARKERWRDVGVRPPSRAKSFTVHKGQDPKSFVMLNFQGTAKFSAEAEDDVRMLAEVMDIRLREVLREEMSGVYGAFSYGGIERRPKPRYRYAIGFGCSPDNAAALKSAVFDIATEIKKSGAADDYITKVREQRRRKLETDRKENRWWSRQLVDTYRYGTDPKELLELDEMVERVDSKRVQQAAKRYLNQRGLVDGLLVPEVEATPAG